MTEYILVMVVHTHLLRFSYMPMPSKDRSIASAYARN